MLIPDTNEDWDQSRVEKEILKDYNDFLAEYPEYVFFSYRVLDEDCIKQAADRWIYFKSNRVALKSQHKDYDFNHI